MTVLLSLENVSKRFGSIRVAEGLCLELEAGEALGLVGPNGAGKTTLFNLITGDVAADSGRILLRGRDITRAAPYRRCRAGIGRSYQVALPFLGLTVFENVLVGAMQGADRREREASDIAVATLSRCALTEKANRLAGSLTLLDRKRLELARALATQPAVLLLDEVAGGLTEHEAQQLVELVNAIRADGVAIIWVEHVLHALLAVITRLIVMANGAMLAEGAPRAVMESTEVRRAYLGLPV